MPEIGSCLENIGQARHSPESNTGLGKNIALQMTIFQLINKQVVE